MKTSRLPMIYVAGPYTAPEPVANTGRAIAFGMRIFDARVGYPVIPHLTLLAQLVDPRPVEYWYAFDNAVIPHCHALVRLDGASPGADAEEALALALHIPIFGELQWGALCDWSAEWRRADVAVPGGRT